MKEFLIQFKEDESGQSLIEILIALTIGAILIGAASVAVVTVLQSGTSSERQQTAATLAEDYIAKARTIAGSDWHSLDGLTKSSSTLYHFGVSASSSIVILEGEEGIISDDIRENLVGYWGLDEASSTIVYDKSGNNDGTINGASATSTDNCKVGRCYSFDGVDDYIASDSNLGISGDAEFTMCSWVKWTGNSWSSNYPSFIGNDSTGSAGQGLSFTVKDGQPAVDFWNNRFRAIDSLSVNTWYHLCGTKIPGIISSSTTAIYVNGTSVLGGVENNSAAPNITDEPAIIGRLDSARWFEGLIDDVRIYNRALSATEIDNMYNSSFFDRSFYVEDVCRTNDSNYEISGTAPCASGSVEDPSTVKITVQATWGSDGEFIVEDYITRWRNRTFPQTDWSGGAGFDGPFTTPTNTYSTSTNISTSTGGIQVEGI